MKPISRRTTAILLLMGLSFSCGPYAKEAGPEVNATNPNIVIIFVDDMGYGDPQCFNSKSLLKTPAIDRLATEGLMFTDAHAPAAFVSHPDTVCSQGVIR